MAAGAHAVLAIGIYTIAAVLTSGVDKIKDGELVTV
jgi:hypothetical protein